MHLFCGVRWGKAQLRTAMCLTLLAVFLASFAFHNNASGIAKASTITVFSQSTTLSAQLMISSGGTFGKSGDATVSVSTDNFTGYNLTITASSGDSLENGDGDEIKSISTTVTEQAFSTNSAYNNKWGFRPSQYVTSSGGVDTVVSNSDYLPAPTNQGLLIARTTSANSLDGNNDMIPDSYTFSFGARIDSTLPAGSYSATYIIAVVANDITYNVTYDDSSSVTSETVTNMPSPNPQALQIAGATPTAQSYASLSNSVPIMDSGNLSFYGWCDVPVTYNSVTQNYDCSGNTYSAGADYPIDQTSSATNITLYAIWVVDPFPTVWSQMGKCEFHGDTPSTITGSDCTRYWNDYYIDTGIALNSQANATKDYEVHFTIDRFLLSENPTSKNDGQQTFFSTKVPSSTTINGGTAPGVIVRRSSNDISFESKMGSLNPRKGYGATVVQEASVYRIDGILYVSVNGGPLYMLQDLSTYDQFFELTTWFGAYPNTSGCDGSAQKPCDTSKRYIEAELSNMYIKLGDYDSSNLYNITFDANGGTPATTNYLVVNGNSISALPEVTRSGWFFDGWWTASSDGQQITTATVPTATTTYYAHWYKSVADAQITNTSISMSVSDTETINITNAYDIEPYTLASSDSNVATVNSAGEITAVGNGTATITITGTNTGDTRTISVTVGTMIYVDFDSGGGSPATYQWPVADGGSFSSLPEPTYPGHELEGWYTGADGTGTQLTTSTVFDTNTPTQYYANWTQVNYVCKAGTVQHEEPCSKSSSGNGCRGAGYASNAPISYGSLIQTGATSLVAGNALTCDINNDNTFDETNERFYYYTTVGNNAALIYYKNISNDENLWADGLALLPTSSTTGWTNPNLVTFGAGDYNGKVARYMSYDETVATCDNTSTNFGTNGKCLYILEQSNFAYDNIRDGYWVGSTDSSRVHTSTRKLTSASRKNGVRPVIEVPLSMIDLTVQAPQYDITFNPHNETASWTESIDQGDDLTDVYPATDPTYTNHLFQGWFTADTGGTQISSSTIPSGDTEYHAQWLKTVTLATLSSNSISVGEGYAETISVTNSAELEPYSFSSLNTSIATVDSSTGVVTGVAGGTTSIRITGTTSGAYVDVPVSVVAMVCKLASTNTLHTGPNGDYGQIAINTTPQAGDAYDCDVNNDGTYSASNERFYYLSQDSSNNAVLVAWNSYYNGDWAPGTSSDSYYHYADALLQLPSNAAGAWDHPGLIEQDTGKAARFMNYTEVVSACGNINVTATGALDACDYLMEHSAYDSGGRSALWLNYDGSTYRRIHAGSGKHSVDTVSDPNGSNNMARPAIVVPDNLIEKKLEDYSVTFDPQNGDSSSTITVTSGNSIGADMPQDPTYTNHAFVRWYDTSNDNTVTSATVPSATMSVYAEWKLDVTQAVISNADLTLAASDTLTLLVGNSSQLEPYTFSSADTSIATVDASTGVITGVSAGTVNIIMTGTLSSLTKSIEVEVTGAQVVKRTVTFNANGGTTPTPSAIYQIDDGDQVGSLPTTSRANYRFFGWYKDDGTFYDEVYQDETINADVVFYARWVEDTTSFPIEFAEINECEFNGNAVISGDYCTQDKTKKFVDSGQALFSTTNYQKDFEIGFTITDLTLPQPVSQGTLVNSKYENGGMNYPGFVFRSVSGDGENFELTARFSHGSPTNFTTAGSGLKRVKIVRENQVLKYSINDGALTTWYDVTNNARRFDTNVWFGAAAQSNGTSPQRFLTGKLTDMYVKVKPLSAPTEYLINFNPGSGSFTDPTDSSRTVTVNDSLGTLPVPNPPTSNHTFVGWFDESTSPATQVTDSTVPTSGKTYVAHYSYQSSNTPVEFDVSNNATRGYQSLMDDWVPSPVGITTFHKASPINSSTWGDTSELSEQEYWEEIRDNFIDNECLIPSYSDAVKPLSALPAWTSGSVDCSKPDAYDTEIGSALTVRLNNAQGAVVSYAKADNGVIHNMIPGQTYYWEDQNDSTVYGYVTATSKNGTRWVDTGTIRNVRDLGGLPVTYTDTNSQTVTGTVAYGRLFRGEKLEKAPATELTNLGITTEYNVGDEYSSDTHLTDYHLNQVVHYDFDYNSGDENNPSSNYMKAWTAVTNIMTDIVDTSTTKNIFFHCRVGADRTGTVAYLLEGLLGVPDEMRYEEYALTNLSGLYDRTRYYKLKASNNANKFVFMMGYVQTTQDIYDWYMHNSNASTSLIQAFRTAMTVPSNQQQQSPQNAPSQQQMSPMSLNNTDGGQTNTSGAESSVPTEGYTSPLGVTEASATTKINTSGSDSPVTAGVAIVATMMAIVGGGTYVLSKQERPDSQ